MRKKQQLGIFIKRQSVHYNIYDIPLLFCKCVHSIGTCENPTPRETGKRLTMYQ